MRQGWFRSIAVWWAIGLLWGGIEALAHRQAMNPDGISYLDMASTGELVNPVWSPLYPALLRVALRAVRPSGMAEFALVHAVNFAIFAVALACFTFFLISWAAGNERRRSYAIPAGFGMFLWIALEEIGLASVNPDMCVAAVVFLIAGMVCRFSDRAGWYAAFGALLGVGYYAKASLLPLGLILLAILVVLPPSGKVRIGGPMLAAAVFAVVAAPLAIAMTRKVGHPSFGEAGKLNYLWHVSGVEQFAGWTGASAVHPPRVLWEKPRVLEFAAPVRGTYPLWFDPSYWYEGASAPFSVLRQGKAIATNLEQLMFAAFRMGALVAGAAVLAIFAKGAAAENRNRRWAVGWGAAAVLLFLPVHLEIRYVAPFLILLWIAVFDYFSGKADESVSRAVLGVALGALYCTSATAFLVDWKAAVHPKPQAYRIVAQEMLAEGLGEGDKIAVTGLGFEAYYARVTRARIAAEVRGDEFWSLDPEALAALKHRLVAAGIKAIIAKDRPEEPGAGNRGGEDGWKDVATPEGRYSILRIGP